MSWAATVVKAWPVIAVREQWSVSRYRRRARRATPNRESVIDAKNAK